MATHFSIFAWEISWTKEPDGLQSMGSQSQTLLLLSLLLLSLLLEVKKSLLRHNYFYFVDEDVILNPGNLFELSGELLKCTGPWAPPDGN